MPRTIGALFASALALIISYPQIQWWPLAWVALVPYLLVLDTKTYRAAFGWSFVLGFVFFFGTLGWLVYVSPAAIFVFLYLALYFSFFGLAFKFFQPLLLLGRLFILPAAWVLLEFVRDHLFTGFGWAMLGYSQAPNLLLIQIADITGVYGVSFLVVMVNVLVFESIKSGSDNVSQIRRAQVLVIGILLAVLAYGFWRLASAPNLRTVMIGVVQPNIPQNVKWDTSYQPWIVQKTIRLSQDLKNDKPDLIVWPETSIPAVISDMPELVGAVKLTAKNLRTPVLFGGVTDENARYYNSAYLVSTGGEIVQRYDKIHLVPFGEFFPFRPLLGWIYKYVGLDDFTSGQTYTIFQAGNPPARFGVLICFEDTLGYLRRNFVKAGAQFFVNMTNDAWFLDTKAPFMHLQAAVFGCVENKRSLVRAANTGFSGFIDPYGRIIAAVENARHKKTFVDGTALARVPVADEKTFYTKYGDVFTALCLFVILAILLQMRCRAIRP